MEAKRKRYAIPEWMKTYKIPKKVKIEEHPKVTREEIQKKIFKRLLKKRDGPVRILPKRYVPKIVELFPHSHEDKQK